MSALKIDVLMGGPGREAAVSRRSGAAIAAGLQGGGHDVQLIDLAGKLDVGALRPGAVVFNIVHGTYGEDGRLQAELDAVGKTYVGSDARVSALCMDKEATKTVLKAAGIRVPWGVPIHLGSPFQVKDLRLPHFGPLVLKPRSDGSSVGLRLVANPSFILPTCEELLAEVGAIPYLLEEQLPGPEYTVAVLGDGDSAYALPPLVINPASGIFDYEAKYHRLDTAEVPVADAALAARLQALGVAAHRAAGCRDLSRSDVMRTADGEYAVLEINTLPGFTATSLVPKAAAAAGMDFERLVDGLVQRAAARGVGHGAAH
jgi:D-alanine-D-alanine ligase